MAKPVVAARVVTGCGVGIGVGFVASAQNIVNIGLTNDIIIK